MTDREIMQQALEALEHIIYWDNEKPEWEYAHAAITALRSRLAQPEQPTKIDIDYWMSSRSQIIAALAKAGFTLMSNANGFWLEPAPQPEQEPMAWLYRDSWGALKLSQTTPPPVGAFPVYTTPPQRKPLTDEWIHRTTILMGFNPEWTTEIGMAHAIVRAAEAAHGIKENT